MTGRTAAFLACALLVLCLVGLPPWSPPAKLVSNLGDISDDLAFALAHPALFRQGAQWGPDVVFTYGPLGFLAWWPVYPEFVKPVLAYRVVLALVTATLIIAMVWRYFANTWARSLALVLALGNAYLWFIGWNEAMWIAPALCVGILCLSTPDKLPPWLVVLLYVATAIIGTAALVKFSLTTIYVGVYALIGLRDLARRSFPALSLFFIASLLVSWLLAGQHLANLPAWFLTSADLSAGYSDAMSKGFWYPYGPVTVAITYIAALSLILIPMLSRQPLLGRLLLILLAAGVSAVNLKHAFGGNQIEQSVILVGISALLLGFVGSIWSRAAAAICIGACCVVLSLTNFQPRDLLLGFGQARAQAFGMNSALVGNYDAAAGERMFQQIRRLAALPDEFTGTADVYPRKTGVILAAPNLIYHPRPAYLSLNAHTEKLAEQNALFLRSARAPQWVLFEIRPEERVNNRYAATDDGPSWPEIWSRYDLAYTGTLLVYRRRPEPRQLAFHPLERGNVGFEQVININPEIRTWARIDVHRTLLGALVGAIYKAPQVLVNIVCEDGLTATYQIVPALGRAGFLLTPSINSSAEFAALSGRRVKTIRLSVENGNHWFYKSVFGLELSELRLSEP
ncbi:exosortase/archaeosortase family protein [Bradyrhizobium sp. Ai1a-2]|uniref:exosortase/archaeosortase family protein n=1 Tax=Bradyrhizobium sp. Ai1a-2 TaxID=196490 RepID=UPI00041795C9|nr:exosortase/archaeosortase family protein [Bradyrhizobium sp. Ai1a-2]